MRNRPVAEPTRLRPSDLLSEAAASIGARPGRAALTGAGTLLAVGVFVAATGLTATAARQVDAAFGLLAPGIVRVTPVPPIPPAPPGPVPGGVPYPFPANVSARLGKISDVLAAGVYWRVRPATPPLVAVHSPAGRGGLAGIALPVLAATPELLRAAGARIAQGRAFDDWDQNHAQAACLLGPGAAARLGIFRVDDQPTVYIGAVPCTVLGILAGPTRLPATADAVLLPSTAAAAIWGAPPPSGPGGPAVLIETRAGTASAVAAVAPDAVSPFAPHRFAAVAAARLAGTHSQISTVFRDLLLALALTALILGVIGIANVALIAVAERTAEIGLRRAAGARRWHIGAQFLTESALTGLLGGIVGTGVGAAAVVITALAAGWTPVLPPRLLIPAPFIGMAVGLLAGLYPAYRAARTEPALALLKP